MFLILPITCVVVVPGHWTTKEVDVLLMTVPDGATPGLVPVSELAENSASPAFTSKYSPAVEGSVTVYCFTKPTVLMAPTVPVAVPLVVVGAVGVNVTVLLD